MKFSKSTTILLNIVFILVMAFLLKSLITFPRDVYAKAESKYVAVKIKHNEFQETLDKHSNEGLKLHSFSLATASGAKLIVVFER